MEFLAATSITTSALPLSSSGLARFRLIASSKAHRPITCDVFEHFLLYPGPALVSMPLSGRPRCDSHAPRAPNRHTILANSHITSDVDSSRSGPRRFSHRWRQDVLWRHFWSWAPTIPGKSFDCQQQFDIPRVNLRHHLDCSGRLHSIWRPNGVVTRTNSTAEDSQKDAFLPTTFSADAAHQTFCPHGATGLRNLRPTRSSYGVFPSSPGRNQLIVAAACVTNHAKLS